MLSYNGEFVFIKGEIVIFMAFENNGWNVIFKGECVTVNGYFVMNKGWFKGSNVADKGWVVAIKGEFVIL